MAWTYAEIASAILALINVQVPKWQPKLAENGGDVWIALGRPAGMI